MTPMADRMSPAAAKPEAAGRGKAPYVADTEADIRRLGRGGEGNSEAMSDAAERGVTPALAVETRARALSQRQGSQEQHAQDERQDPPPQQDSRQDGSAEARTRRIRDRAHELWLLEGQPEGMSEHHWLMAEKLVEQEERASGSRETSHG